MKNKLKILLISPGNLANQDSEGGRSVVYSPNLGLTYLSSYVESTYGDEVEIAIVETVPERLTDQDMKDKMIDIGPDVVGISSKTFNILASYKLSEIAKSINDRTTVVLGGAHGSALPEYTLKECTHIDIVVRGEGELAFSSVVKSLLKDEVDFSHIDGLAFREADDRIVTTGQGRLLSDLDEVPFPIYDKYNLNNYNMGINPITGQKENFFSMFASRGCPYSCTFCMPLQTRRVRKRAPEKIVEELSYLIETMNAEFVYFEDSCMTADKKWFEAVCDAFIANNMIEKLSWGFETRVDSVNKELFRKAVRAGSIYVNFGLESGSDLILERNRKHFKTSDALKTIRLAKEAGVELIHGSFILGLPYENRQTITETLNFIDGLNIDMIAVNIVDVYPGTELFDMVERGEGGIRWLPGFRFNWEKYERNKCQTEVNDLTASDLADYYNRALDLVEKKTGQRLTI